MRKIHLPFLPTFLMLTFLFVIGFTFSSCRNDEKKRERIVCGIKVADNHYDIGKVDSRLDTQNMKRFCYVLQNTTDQRVQLESVEGSCSCLTIEYYPMSIEAYSRDSLVGYIDVTNLVGSFSRSIYVNFKSGDVMLLRVIGHGIED